MSNSGNKAMIFCANIVSAALSTTIGAAVLERAGYSNYNASDAVQMGMTGGTLIGIIAAMSEASSTAWLTSTVFSSFLGGVLGKVILEASTKMSASQTATASAVGDGVILAGIGGVAAVVSCCGFFARRSNALPLENIPLAPENSSTASYSSVSAV